MKIEARQMIASREGIGATGHITQATRLGFVSITAVLPMLVVVFRGRKTVKWKTDVFTVEAGEAIAIKQGHSFEFENVPAADGNYEARWLTVDAALVRCFGAAHGRQTVAPARLLGKMERGLVGAFDAAVAALVNEDGLPDVVIEHRVSELLAWLASHDLCFSAVQSENHAERIRALIAARPQHRWSCKELCGLLGTSEATLRRRLQAHDTSLREIVSDVRMTHALSLLQSTDVPISVVAAHSGYESQSKFAICFRKRFGFVPTAVRGHSRRERAPAAKATLPAGLVSV